MTDLKIITHSGEINQYSGNLSITHTGTGELTRDHIEIIKVYNDSYYINQDTFSYLLILTIVGLILYKTIIGIFIYGFKLGFYLTSGGKILGEK